MLAAEANPSVRQKLRDNLNLNRFRQVEIVPYALADAEGTLAFHGPEADDPDSGNGHVVRDGAEPRVGIIQVEACRLDRVASAAGIGRLDLIKIDVEGYEWPVLQGADQTIANFRPHIVFEYDAAYAPRAGGSPPALADFFRRHRYRLFAVRRSWAEPVRSDFWPDCANIWAAPLS